jgi:dihydrofolate reductase
MAAALKSAGGAMRKIYLFMMVSLDGYFEGQNHDLSWHHVDAEFNEFVIEQLDETDVLLFGRVTYRMMAGYWPTRQGYCRSRQLKFDGEPPAAGFHRRAQDHGESRRSGWRDVLVQRHA